ncbi:hypothetical protein [Dongia mobilis]|jgi:hypothetical protein|uniref:hypothetical protein n=1 Tax=Dongia sp. TaxID=1977262 RepID=UPI0026F19805
MRPISKTIWLAIAVAMMFCAAGSPHTAAANGPPTYRLRCAGSSGGVEQIICANIALMVANNKLSRAYGEIRDFFFASEVGNGFPKISAMARNDLRLWAIECGIAPESNSDHAPISAMTLSCLMERIRIRHIELRCPLFINTGGPESEAEQIAWFKRNIDFCEQETGYDFDLPE